MLSNALAETFIASNVEQRMASASSTLGFIEKQLEDVTDRLTNSELELEQYKKNEGIINTRQETETGLRQISELEIQLANLRMKEASMDQLDEYINEGRKDFMDLAPNFEAFGDILFVELIKQIKALSNERIDLLANYTESSDKITRLDSKIAETISYIKESIKNSRKTCALQSAEIEKVLGKSQEQFVDLPEKEKKMVMLERDFQLNQKIYLFLTEKRMESEIAQSAALSFHRIIEFAEVPEKPINPNRMMITLVITFLGMLLGILILFIKEIFFGKIRSVTEVQSESKLPLIGIVKKAKNNTPAGMGSLMEFVASLELKGAVPKGTTLFVSDTQQSGATPSLSLEMAQTFALQGKKTLWISSESSGNLGAENDNVRPGLAEFVLDEISKEEGIHPTATKGLFVMEPGKKGALAALALSRADTREKLKTISATYDLVIIEGDLNGNRILAISLLKTAALGVQIVHQNQQSRSDIAQIAQLTEEYHIDHLHLLVNEAVQPNVSPLRVLQSLRHRLSRPGKKAQLPLVSASYPTENA